MQEVWDTFVVLARLGSQCVEAYVISMASRASDVLAVELLKREACRKVGTQAPGFCGAGISEPECVLQMPS